MVCQRLTSARCSRTVAGILAAHRIHAVVVVDDDVDAGWLVVSDRDAVKSHSRGELDQLTAREAASAPTLTIHEDADLRHAAELMAHYGTSHVIVTRSGGGRPTGILSSLDIASGSPGSSRPHSWAFGRSELRAHALGHDEVPLPLVALERLFEGVHRFGRAVSQ